jgi:hypothetical protein
MPTAIGTYSCRKDCCACSSLLKLGRLPDLSLSFELYTRSSRSSAKLQHTCSSEKESHLSERLTKITLHRCQAAVVVALTPALTKALVVQPLPYAFEQSRGLFSAVSCSLLASAALNSSVLSRPGDAAPKDCSTNCRRLMGLPLLLVVN